MIQNVLYSVLTHSLIYYPLHTENEDDFFTKIIIKKK